MNKIKIIVAACVLILMGVVIVSFLLNSDDTAIESPVVFPEVDPTLERQTQDSFGDAVVLSTKAGRSVQIRNFMEDADTYELSDDGIYVIGEKDESIGDNYKIYYHDFDGSIIVSLRSIPLATVRVLAEVELKKTTGLIESQLCDMNIVVNTPRDVSESYSGRDLGLSFCPGSVSLQ
jgi:hypothetical protein